MPKSKRIKHKPIGFLNLVLLVGVLLTGGTFLLAVFYKFPWVSASRDWLSILADFVQSLSFVFIVAFIFDALQKDQEMNKSRHPIIVVNSIKPTDSQPPKLAYQALCEVSKSEAQSNVQTVLIELDEERNDYLELWEKLGQPKRQEKNYYWRIQIRNIQGTAKNLRLYLRLDYKEEFEAVPTISKYILCPPDGMTINSNDTKLLFIRCGKIDGDEYKLVGGQIENYTCENIDGEILEGLGNKFEPISIPLYKFPVG